MDELSEEDKADGGAGSEDPALPLSQPFFVAEVFTGQAAAT